MDSETVRPVLEMDFAKLPWTAPINLSVSIMLEGWTDAGAPGLGPMGNPLKNGVLDRQAQSWAAYGPNFGARHLLSALRDLNVKAVFYVSGIVAERFKPLLKEIVADGHTLAAHGYAQDLMTAYRTEEEERSDLERSMAAIKQATGATPRGWMSARCTPSAHTEQLLLEHDFWWTADTFDRDLPGPVLVGSPLIAMPFTTAVNDMPLSVRYGDVPSAYTSSFRRILALWAKAKLSPACLDITAHSHVFGRPNGVLEFRAALEAAKQSPLVKLTTHAELAAICRATGEGAHD